MQELEYLNENIQQNALSALLAGFIVAVKTGLGQLDIPVAVIIPDKVVDLAGGNTELKAVHIIADFFDNAVEL